jgi:hypothetical protein
MIRKLDILRIAVTEWFKGRSWEDAVWYARVVVYGWKK